MSTLSCKSATMQSIWYCLPLLTLVETINCASVCNVLNGKNLKVAAQHWPPFFIIHEHPLYPGYFMYFGVMEQLLQELRASLNFTTTVVQPPDGLWGNYDPQTKNWNGMLGMVHRKEVDFALGNKKITQFSLFLLYILLECIFNPSSQVLL